MLGDKESIEIAYALEKSSEHPLAESFVHFAKKKGIKENGKVTAFSAVPGKGIEGTIGGKKCALGSIRLMKESGAKVPKKILDWKTSMEEKGSTVVLLSVGKEVDSAFAVADQIREDSVDAIRRLKEMGIKTFMITGDNARVAAVIAKEAGIDEFHAEVLPDEKAKIVKEIGKELKIGMVGDGINDAPALAVSDLGIAMGSGTDVAIETGDIILMRSSLMDVPRAILLSKATMGKIKQNLFWALVYNVIGIPVAAGVLFPFFGVLLSPMLAGGAMALSSVSVVTNSLMLNRSKL
jgi:Cu+-exporting ATPase